MKPTPLVACLSGEEETRRVSWRSEAWRAPLEVLSFTSSWKPVRESTSSPRAQRPPPDPRDWSWHANGILVGTCK